MVYDKNLYTDFGIAPNSGVSVTSALQSAMDSYSAEGGGSIYVPAGTYLLSSLCMRSNIHLYLDPGVVLSPNSANGEYIVNISNITSVGFPEGNDKGFYYLGGEDPDTGEITAGIGSSRTWPFVRAIKQANGVESVSPAIFSE
ncbi:MAG: glycosyl hydrolase family 28-related protein [Rikenellaceae bacterium]